MINAADLVSTGEIARRLGVTPAAVSNWRKRYESFPHSIGGLHRGGLYLWPEVDAWYRQFRTGLTAIGNRLAPYTVTHPPIPRGAGRFWQFIECRVHPALCIVHSPIMPIMLRCMGVWPVQIPHSWWILAAGVPEGAHMPTLSERESCSNGYLVGSSPVTARARLVGGWDSNAASERQPMELPPYASKPLRG